MIYFLKKFNVFNVLVVLIWFSLQENVYKTRILIKIVKYLMIAGDAFFAKFFTIFSEENATIYSKIDSINTKFIYLF